jgi:4-hydroxy-2-oxoglutarate aldolase
MTVSSASHLSDVERSSLIRSARDALDDNDLSHVPIVAGTGTGSATETSRLCIEARDAGADYVIVIPPGYFSSVIARDMAALKAFYLSVFDKSRE